MTEPLHLTTEGTGEPVILLHSGGMSARQWKMLSRTLSKTHRAIAPDFIGSGDNPLWSGGEGGGAGEFKFEMDVDAASAIAQGLNAPFHLVGHSYGGFIALMLARRMPERVKSLSLYDPVAFGVLRASGDPVGLADLERAESNPVFNDRNLCGGDAWFEVFVDYWNGQGSWRALPAPTRAGFLRIGQKVFFEVYSLMHDRTPASAYANVRAPTLLMTGQNSPPAAHRVVALLCEALDARIMTVEGGGHMGPITHARVVNDAIVQHICSAS